MSVYAYKCSQTSLVHGPSDVTEEKLGNTHSPVQPRAWVSSQLYTRIAQKAINLIRKAQLPPAS